jgi:hypothetical protein
MFLRTIGEEMQSRLRDRGDATRGRLDETSRLVVFMFPDDALLSRALAVRIPREGATTFAP